MTVVIGTRRMGVIAAVRKLVTGSATPAEIEAEIAAERAKATAATAEAERLEESIAHEADFDRAEAIERQARRQRHAARVVEARLAELAQHLADAKAAHQREALRRHAAALDAAGRRVIESLEALGRAQAAAIGAWDAACAELGAQFVEVRLARVHFGGIPLPDLIPSWVANTERQLAGVTERLARPKPMQIAAPQTPDPGAVPISRQVARTGDSRDRKGAERKPNSTLQHAVALSEREPAPGRAAPLPDDLAPLAADECRCRVARSGYEDVNGAQSQRDRIIRQKRDKAEIAQRAGAVEIIEGAAK